MAEYTPSEGQVREWCCAGTGEYHDLMNAWITRFLERVKRDAAREALDGLMHRFELEQGHAASLNRGLDAQRAKLSRLTAETYRETNYPTETEDQT